MQIYLNLAGLTITRPHPGNQSRVVVTIDGHRVSLSEDDMGQHFMHVGLSSPIPPHIRTRIRRCVHSENIHDGRQVAHMVLGSHVTKSGKSGAEVTLDVVSNGAFVRVTVHATTPAALKQMRRLVLTGRRKPEYPFIPYVDDRLMAS